MDNEANGDFDDVIESSQVPSLRESVRKCRVYYGEHNPPKVSDSKRRKKNEARQQFNATVSQCMQQEWKSPSVRTRTFLHAKVNNRLAIEPNAPEEYVKFVTQHDGGQVIDANPSVNLFEKQEEVIQRYMLNEASEAQQEEMLDKILQGFRTSYEVASARIAGASPDAKALNMLPNSNEKVPNLEPNVSPDLLERFLEPVVQLVELPQEAFLEKDVRPMTMVHECLDLSKKRGKSNRDRTQIDRARMEHCQQNPNGLSTTFNDRTPFANGNDILDLHVSPVLPQKDSTRSKNYVSQFSQHPQQEHFTCKKIRHTSTSETATQTRRSKHCRNAGIQHRPLASFEMTKHKVISLARMIGTNPDDLYGKMRQVATLSYSESLWQARNLSQVFTHEDPYYANLDYFMSARF